MSMPPPPIPRLLFPATIAGSALPETLDPALYANILPCCGGGGGGGGGDTAGQGGRLPLSQPRNLQSFEEGESADVANPLWPGAATAGVAAAAERQRDPSTLAAWYAARARQIESRSGLLRHASCMCRLGIERIAAGSLDGGGGSDAGGGDGYGGGGGGGGGGNGVGGAGSAVARVAGYVLADLLRLQRLLDHLASLVSYVVFFVIRGGGAFSPIGGRIGSGLVGACKGAGVGMVRASATAAAAAAAAAEAAVASSMQRD